jgi:transposase
VARHELAAEFLQDLRRIDAQLRDTKKRLAVAIKASGTTVTDVFGVGPVIAELAVASCLAGDASGAAALRRS